MDFKLKDARPIWQQLADQITQSIIIGKFPPGERLPSVRDLAVQAGVNPNTMQRAMSKLEADGLLVTVRTAGRTVTEDEEIIKLTKQRLAAELVAGFIENMEKLGFNEKKAAELVAGYRKEKQNEH